MAQLTQEFFERTLETKLASQTKELKAFAQEQTEELARIVHAGFDGVDLRFGEVIKLIDVRKDVDELKVQVMEIRQALNLKH